MISTSYQSLGIIESLYAFWETWYGVWYDMVWSYKQDTHIFKTEIDYNKKSKLYLMFYHFI